jgi:hypothetical protein
MKNEGNDGIFCDYCGSEVKEDFTYYSFDFNEVKLNEKFSRQSGHIALSADLCERCMELFRQRLLNVTKKIPESTSRCDVTGGKFDARDKVYYKCHISRVKVDMSHQPYVCDKCHKPQDPQQGPCDCNPDAVTLVKEASVEADDQHLDLNFCAEIFAKFRRQVEYIKGLGEAEWTKA